MPNKHVERILYLVKYLKSLFKYPRGSHPLALFFTCFIGVLLSFILHKCLCHHCPLQLTEIGFAPLLVVYIVCVPTCF